MVETCRCAPLGARGGCLPGCFEPGPAEVSDGLRIAYGSPKDDAAACKRGTMKSMADQRPMAFAKTTRPAITAIVPPERLFARLARRPGRTVAGISGPPG